MDKLKKLEILSGSAKFDIPGSPTSKRKVRRADRLGSPSRSPICHATAPDGRNISLFRIMLTNSCEMSCAYCPCSARRDEPKARLEADELAELFLDFYKRNLVEGIFLTSAVNRSPGYSMDEMIKTVELLRKRHKYAGYIHCKIVPGADRASIETLAQYVDRLSINIEAPNEAALKQIAPEKNYQQDLIERMRWVRDIIIRNNPSRRPGRGRPAGALTAGQTTQFVVGAAGESDREIVESAQQLTDELDLRRVHFGAFFPVAGTPLENRPAAPSQRQHRLYQADWLLRFYGFSREELPYDEKGNLTLARDPKLEYALRRPELFPVEINAADIEELLRVPGIGPRSAFRIVNSRAYCKISSLRQLQELGAVAKRARPFILIDGKRQGSLEDLNGPQQLSLFETDE